MFDDNYESQHRGVSGRKEYMNNPYLANYFQKNNDILPNVSVDLEEYQNNLSIEDEKEKIAFNFDDCEVDDVPIPSNLRVSTMTAICSINMNIDLALFFEKLTLDSEEFPYIKSCQFGNDNIKGDNLKKPRKKRNKEKTTKRNYFQNQATLVIIINEKRKVNLKIFRNGKIQMTGLKCKEEGLVACEKLLQEINKLKIDNPGIVYPNEGEKETPTNLISSFSIVLINSDFFGGFKVKREKLYEILSRDKYFVSYEPDIYPGVNAKYFWNINTVNKDKPGICECTVPCDGKGDGSGNGKCKKITIATFQSGNIIITGARNNRQTMDAYTFINNLFKKHYKYIVRVSNNDNDTHSEHNQKIRISSSDIINYELREKLLNKIAN